MNQTTAHAISESRAALGRLSAEFVVIVVGVLVALGVDSAITAREEIRREAEYLEQLQVEVAAMEEARSVALGNAAEVLRRSTNVLVGIGSDPIPPADSMDAWFAGSLVGGGFEPSLITLRTLIASGDLLLIRDPLVRAQLVRLEEWLVQIGRAQEFVTGQMAEGVSTISQRADLGVLAPQFFGTPPVAGQWNWEELSRDVAFRSALYTLANAARNNVAGLEGSATFLEEVAAVLESARSNE